MKGVTAQRSRQYRQQCFRLPAQVMPSKDGITEAPYGWTLSVCSGSRALSQTGNVFVRGTH